MCTMFREEATSALAGFHAGPLSWSNWNIEVLVFVEEGKPEYLEKNENQQQTHDQLTYGTGSESNPGHVGGRRALFTTAQSLPHLRTRHCEAIIL